MIDHTDDRAEYMGFTRPYHVLETSLVTLEETNLDMEMEGLRLLTIRNYEIEDWWDNNRLGIEHMPLCKRLRAPLWPDRRIGYAADSIGVGRCAPAEIKNDGSTKAQMASVVWTGVEVSAPGDTGGGV